MTSDRNGAKERSGDVWYVRLLLGVGVILVAGAAIYLITIPQVFATKQEVAKNSIKCEDNKDKVLEKLEIMHKDMGDIKINLQELKSNSEHIKENLDNETLRSTAADKELENDINSLRPH